MAQIQDFHTSSGLADMKKETMESECGSRRVCSPLGVPLPVNRWHSPAPHEPIFGPRRLPWEPLQATSTLFLVTTMDETRYAAAQALHPDVPSMKEDADRGCSPAPSWILDHTEPPQMCPSVTAGPQALTRARHTVGEGPGSRSRLTAIPEKRT